MQKRNEVETMAEQPTVQFYGEVDLNQKGELASYMPAWSYTQLIEDLKEQIDSKRRALDSGALEAEKLVSTREEHKKLKERYDAIIASKPKINEDLLDRVSKVIGDKISEASFTYDQRQKGLADAHEEARRMVQPCIELTDDAASLAVAARIKGVKKGSKYMVSRTQAEKLWKLTRRALGEPSNVQSLRK